MTMILKRSAGFGLAAFDLISDCDLAFGRVFGSNDRTGDFRLNSTGGRRNECFPTMMRRIVGFCCV